MEGLVQGHRVSARAEADLSLGEVQGRDAVTLQAGPIPSPQGPGCLADKAEPCVGPWFSPCTEHQDLGGSLNTDFWVPPPRL